MVFFNSGNFDKTIQANKAYLFVSILPFVIRVVYLLSANYWLSLVLLLTPLSQRTLLYRKFILFSSYLVLLAAYNFHRAWPKFDWQQKYHFVPYPKQPHLGPRERDLVGSLCTQL